MMRALFISMIVAATALAQPAEHPAKAELLADVSAIKPGEPFTLGIRLTMQPHWHVYWLNPGDSGQAPAVEWTLPDGFDAGTLRFPVPMRFEQAGGLAGYGYEGEVLLTTSITPPADLPTGQRVKLDAAVDWLVCDPDVCIPGGAALSIELPVAGAAKPANEQLFRHWTSLVPQRADQSPAVSRVEAPTTLDRSGRAQEIIVHWNGAARAIDWFPPPSDQITFGDIEMNTSNAKTTIRFTATALAGKNPPAQTLESVLAYSVNGQRKGLLIPLQTAAPPDAAAAKVSNP